MNLLIVDDQPNVLLALNETIAWKKYGIDAVYTASSVLTAKTILATKDIQLLLTDIEMPVENGIDLIHWVRERNLEMECILLTSHADFFYARQAIALDVVDYVLQPAKNEDVIRAVINAKERHQQKFETQKMMKSWYFSSTEKNHAAKRFMENWPENTADETFEKELLARIDRLRSLGLPCRAEDSCILFTTQFDSWFTLPPVTADLYNQYNEILTEVFSFINARHDSHFFDESHCFSLLLTPLAADLENYLSILSAHIKQKLNCAVSICYAQSSFRELRYSYQYMTKTEDLFDSSQTSIIQKIQLPEHYLIGSQLPQSYKKYFERIETFIAANISLPISRAELAEAIHLSPDYVSHIIRAAAGCSCKEFVTRKKMKYAKRLIRTTDQPIGNIAVQCGYDSFAYFSKVYKSVNQISPSQERSAKSH